MTETRFFVGRPFLTRSGVALAAIVAVALFSLARRDILGVALMAPWCLYFVRGFCRRGRPAVEISGGNLRWGLAFGLRRSRCVPLSEIAGVEVASFQRLRIVQKSGGSQPLWLHEIRRSERAAVRAAIAGRIGGG